MPSYAQETGVIKVGTLAKIRRLYFRDKQSIKEICRQTGMSRNTVRSWLRDPEMVEPKYPVWTWSCPDLTDTLSLSQEGVSNAKKVQLNRPVFELTPRSWTNFKGFHGKVQNGVQAPSRE